MGGCGGAEVGRHRRRGAATGRRSSGAAWRHGTGWQRRRMAKHLGLKPLVLVTGYTECTQHLLQTKPTAGYDGVWLMVIVRRCLRFQGFESRAKGQNCLPPGRRAFWHASRSSVSSRNPALLRAMCSPVTQAIPNSAPYPCACVLAAVLLTRCQPCHRP